MILVTRRDEQGQPVAWMDLDTRIWHDTGRGSVEERPFTDQENALADGLLAAIVTEEQRAALRAQLAGGVTQIEAARAAAAADVAVAEGLRDQATTARAAAQAQRTTIAAWTPGSTYRAADLTAVRDQLATVLDRQALILEALGLGFTYRAAVDRNAVTTDDALLWLARLAAGLLTDQEA